jgi:3-oxoacyl-[acyl-carrier protein] reductase
VVLITGAARGLGRATAARLLECGATVAVNVRTQQRADRLAADLGERALGIGGDVSDAADVTTMVQRVTDAHGRVDILVNNAAAVYSTRFEQIPESEWRRSVDVNLTGPFLLIQAVAPFMKAEGFGRVINVSSLAGRSVSTLAGVHYSASKAALLGLTRAAAKELAPHGITVNAVCPGLIDTELVHETATDERIEMIRSQRIPAQRLGRPVEVADLVCFLVSDQAGYITGASIDINGGSLMM